MTFIYLKKSFIFLSELGGTGDQVVISSTLFVYTVESYNCLANTQTCVIPNTPKTDYKRDLRQPSASIETLRSAVYCLASLLYDNRNIA